LEKAVTERQRNYTLHGEKQRSCDNCNSFYPVINMNQRFCNKACYVSWHSKANNEKSNSQRKNDGKYVWRHLKDRCQNPDNKSYKDYGGKGVECKFTSFQEFQEFCFRTNECEQCAIPLNDDNRRARDGRNIHRIDSNLHYEKSNCMIVCKKCNNFLDRNDKRGWM